MNRTTIIRLLLTVSLALGLAFATAGCGPDDETNNDTTNNASMADAGSNSSSTDEDMAEVEGEFEIGTNELSSANADNFTRLNEGASVPIVWGVQGSWMVVLAFRTHDLISGMFDVRAQISIDGTDAGEIWLEFQETFPGGDGWDYYFNLFLALDADEAPVEGTPATVTLSVEDENGVMAEVTHNVVVGATVGGPNQ